MKRLVLPLLLLFSMLAFCAVITLAVKDTCCRAEDLLRQAEAAMDLGDGAAAETLAAQSRQVWEAHRGLLGLALRHTESDDAELSYPPLLEAAGSGDREDFLQRSRALRASLEALWRMEVPYYYNVL